MKKITKKYLAAIAAVAALAIGVSVVPSSSALTIGTKAEIAAALGVPTGAIDRMQIAVGRHQGLKDAQGKPRIATLREAIDEMLGRMKELVQREEGKVREARAAAVADSLVPPAAEWGK